MEETRPFVSWDLVHDFMVDVFVKYGGMHAFVQMFCWKATDAVSRATAATASSLFTWIVLKTAPCCRKPKLKL